MAIGLSNIHVSMCHQYKFVSNISSIFIITIISSPMRHEHPELSLVRGKAL